MSALADQLRAETARIVRPNDANIVTLDIERLPGKFTAEFWDLNDFKGRRIRYDTVVEWPESGAMWPGWDSIPVVRPRRVGGFPFRLVYLVQPTELVVVAVAHDKRLPGYWRERVTE